MSEREQGQPVARPDRLVVLLYPDVSGPPRPPLWNIFPSAEVLVDMHTGHTVPRGVRLPPPGFVVAGGTIQEGMGRDVCGLGGRHRWVLEAARLTHAEPGSTGRQLMMDVAA